MFGFVKMFFYISHLGLTLFNFPPIFPIQIFFCFVQPWGDMGGPGEFPYP